MVKDLYLSILEQLIDAELEKHPDASEADLYESLSDRAYALYLESWADRADSIRMLEKDARYEH